MPSRTHTIPHISRTRSKRCATFVFPGLAFVGYRTGWALPANPGSIAGWRATAFVAPSSAGDVVVDVFDKNGDTIFASNKVVIPGGSTDIESDTNIVGPLVVAPGVDRFYAEILSIGGSDAPGEDITVVLYYS